MNWSESPIPFLNDDKGYSMSSHEEEANQPVSPAKQGMENLIVCSKCQNVYDIRYLSEMCRFEEEVGYQCMNCGTIL